MTERFEKTPTELLISRAVSLQAKATYALLRMFAFEAGAEDDTYVELPPVHAMATRIGVGKKTLNGYIGELKASGWVETRRAARDRPQIYKIRACSWSHIDSAGGVILTPPSFTDESDSPSGKPEGGSRARKPNIPFDALAAATNANTAISGSEIARALKAIRTATSDEWQQVRQRFLAEESAYDDVPAEWADNWLARRIEQGAADYRRERPEWELTPSALAKHWNRIATWKQGTTQRFECPHCAGLTFPSRAKLRDHLYNTHDEETA